MTGGGHTGADKTVFGIVQPDTKIESFPAVDRWDPEPAVIFIKKGYELLRIRIERYAMIQNSVIGLLIVGAIHHNSLIHRNILCYLVPLLFQTAVTDLFLDLSHIQLIERDIQHA